MSQVLERMKECLAISAAPDRVLIADAINEFAELRMRCDRMEEILIVLVRTGLPWGEDGMPNERFDSFKVRYENALHEASELVGLEFRSALTRTEPKTM